MTVISDVKARAYTIPTEEEESDGTLKWSSTTMVVVQVRAGGRCGLGWSYSSSAVVDVIRETLAPQVVTLFSSIFYYVSFSPFPREGRFHGTEK